jgi:arsenate reductase
MAAEPIRILFICTGNSARSQLAEGLANHLGQGAVEAHSAGTMPFGVNPHAIEVLKEIGIDISGHYSKSVEEVPGPFDRVITLCDSAAALCPAPIRGAPTDHWSTPDPSFGPGGPDVVRQAFRDVRDRLAKQIDGLIASLRETSRTG